MDLRWRPDRVVSQAERSSPVVRGKQCGVGQRGLGVLAVQQVILVLVQRVRQIRAHIPMVVATVTQA